VADPVHQGLLLGLFIVVAGGQHIQQLGGPLLAAEQRNQGNQRLAGTGGGVLPGGAADEQCLEVFAVAGGV